MQEPETLSAVELSPTQASYRAHSLVYLVVLAAGACFFGLTSPTALPLPLLLVSFVVAGCMLYSVVRLALIVTSLDMRATAFQRRALTGILVVLPVLLLMLQSIGQLTVRDVVTLCLLFGIGFFYFERVLQK